MYLEHISASLSRSLPLAALVGRCERCLMQEMGVCCALAPGDSTRRPAVPRAMAHRRLAVRAEGFAYLMCRQLQRLT